jgi:hypothetical protein
MAHVGCAVVKPTWLSDVDILLDGCVHECCVDVKTAQLEIVCTCDTEEDAEAGKADDMRECFGVIDAVTLAASFSDKPGLLP